LSNFIRKALGKFGCGWYNVIENYYIGGDTALPQKRKPRENLSLGAFVLFFTAKKIGGWVVLSADFRFCRKGFFSVFALSTMFSWENNNL
jgi:hypothetical protein